MTDALAFEVGAALRPIAGETVSGDAYAAFDTEAGVVVTLADGLGHGARAAVAAQTFLRAVGQHAALDLDSMFREAHKSLLRSRGVVAAIATFDPGRRSVEVAIVGNISCSLYRGGRATHFVPIPGVLGSAYRRTRPERQALEPGDLFVMHSDGIRTRHGVDPRQGYTTPAACAEALLEACGKSHDDQSVVVIAVTAGAARRASKHPAALVAIDLPIRTDTDAATSATIAREFAARAGLALRAQWEVGIAVAELTSNVVKYAGHGQLVVRLADPTLLEIVVRDAGRGIRDVQAAVRDGFTEGARPFSPPSSVKPGLGVGLGSVHRMMDEVSIESDPTRGTTVTARKRIPQRPSA